MTEWLNESGKFDPFVLEYADRVASMNGRLSGFTTWVKEVAPEFESTHQCKMSGTSLCAEWSC